MSMSFDYTSQINRAAELSECGQYRWWLHRSWQIWENGEHIRGNGICCFVMLNPSTADGIQDDPTIRRCIGFAKGWGFNSLSVRNLFPWRATDPCELLHASNVTGGERGDVELLTACTADMVVAAWGAGVPFNRDAVALDLFRKHFPGVTIYCLGKTKRGKPRHPLYVKADTKPQIFIPGINQGRQEALNEPKKSNQTSIEGNRKITVDRQMAP